MERVDTVTAYAMGKIVKMKEKEKVDSDAVQGSSKTAAKVVKIIVKVFLNETIRVITGAMKDSNPIFLVLFFVGIEPV